MSEKEILVPKKSDVCSRVLQVEVPLLGKHVSGQLDKIPQDERFPPFFINVTPFSTMALEVYMKLLSQEGGWLVTREVVRGIVSGSDVETIYLKLA